jgi:predicted nucleic acid-binding protein
LTLAICDASVVVKWFHAEGESEVPQARAILAAERRGLLRTLVLDLTYYEMGNFMARRARWSADRIVAGLRDFALVGGSPIRCGVSELARAAVLAADHGLSFYDASYWAVARALGADLVTADSKLLAAGAGESPGDFCERLGLEVADE